MPETQIQKIDWHRVVDAVHAAEASKRQAFKVGGNCYREPYEAARQAALESILYYDECAELKAAGFRRVADQWCRIENDEIVVRCHSDAVRVLDV